VITSAEENNRCVFGVNCERRGGPLVEDGATLLVTRLTVTQAAIATVFEFQDFRSRAQYLLEEQ